MMLYKIKELYKRVKDINTYDYNAKARNLISVCNNIKSIKTEDKFINEYLKSISDIAISITSIYISQYQDNIKTSAIDQLGLLIEINLGEILLTEHTFRA